MAKKSRATFQKREKERARQQKQKDKEQRRLRQKSVDLPAGRTSKAKMRISLAFARGRRLCLNSGSIRNPLTEAPARRCTLPSPYIFPLCDLRTRSHVVHRGHGRPGVTLTRRLPLTHYETHAVLGCHWREYPHAKIG